jgi:glycopeptide antibiotics resistance protein
VIRRHPFVFAGLMAYLIFVCWATLNPAPPDPMSVGPFTLLLAVFAKYPVTAWLTYDMVEFIANIGMFVPIGVLLTVLMGVRRWWLVVLIGVVLTCTIESIQLTMPARHSDVRDLIANSFGTALGAGLTMIAGKLRRTRSKTSSS